MWKMFNSFKFYSLTSFVYSILDEYEELWNNNNQNKYIFLSACFGGGIQVNIVTTLLEARTWVWIGQWIGIFHKDLESLIERVTEGSK